MLTWNMPMPGISMPNPHAGSSEFQCLYSAHTTAAFIFKSCICSTRISTTLFSYLVPKLFHFHKFILFNSSRHRFTITGAQLLRQSLSGCQWPLQPSQSSLSIVTISNCQSSVAPACFQVYVQTYSNQSHSQNKSCARGFIASTDAGSKFLRQIHQSRRTNW